MRTWFEPLKEPAAVVNPLMLNPSNAKTIPFFYKSSFGFSKYFNALVCVFTSDSRMYYWRRDDCIYQYGTYR